MEGLLMATTGSLQEVLEQLPGALRLMSKSMRQLSSAFGFPWAILICIAVMVLIVNGRHAVRRQKELAKIISTCAEEQRKYREKIGLLTAAHKALESSVVEASPLAPQTLRLAALNTNRISPSLNNTVDLLEKEHQSDTRKLVSHGIMMACLQEQSPLHYKAGKFLQSHVTHAGNTLTASQMTGEQLQEEKKDAMIEKTHLQEKLQVTAQERARWQQSVREAKEQIKLLGHSNAGLKGAVQDKECQMQSLNETVLKTVMYPAPFREAYVQDGSLESNNHSESESRDPPSCKSAVDQKKLIDIVNLTISSERLEKEKQEIFKKVCEQKRMCEEMTGKIKDLQKEQAALQSANAKLENEIERLQKKFQILPEIHQNYMMQLEKNSIEEESYCSEMEKKLREVNRNTNFTYQKLNLYKTMAQDVDKELERTTTFYENQIQYYEEKAQEKRLEILAAERKLSEQRKDNDYSRVILAKVELKLHSFPGGPFAPDAPTPSFRDSEASK